MDISTDIQGNVRFPFECIHKLKVSKGTHSTLSEGDVWELPPAVKSRPLFLKFSSAT